MMPSPKEEHTSPMGVQQYTIVIYIRISFEVTIKIVKVIKVDEYLAKTR